MTRTLRADFDGIDRIDRIVRTAPLGVQFRDALDGRVIADGLRVELVDGLRPAKRLPLHANPRGIFVAHAMPGINGFAEPERSSPGAAAGRFSVRVSDRLGRYVDSRFAVEPPSDSLFAPTCLVTSPPEAWTQMPPHVPLYSAATRPLPAATAVVRADLRLDSRADAVACWARVELWLGGLRIATGVADGGGSLLLLCPLPAPREPARRASPPAGFERMAWDVSLRAFWSATNDPRAVPDLCEIHAQPEVGLLARRSPPLPLAALQLRAGEPLAAASAGSSFLFVAA